MGVQIGYRIQGVEHILQGFQALPFGIQKKYLAAAVRAATKDEVATVRSFTPRGPTGNLKRSVGFLVEKKKRSSTATGVLGFRRGGKHKGFHAWWIEEGVKERTSKDPYNKPMRIKVDAKTAALYPYLQDMIAVETDEKDSNGRTRRIGYAFLNKVEGFRGSHRFKRWADSALPRIMGRLQAELSSALQKAEAEAARRQFKRFDK